MELIFSEMPPSVNACYGPTRNGRRVYAKPALRKWKTLAIAQINQQLPSDDRPVFPGAVRIVVTLPNRLNRDAGNCDKALLDALVEAGVIVDDCGAYVRSVTYEWADDNRADVLVLIQATAFDVVRPAKRLVTGSLAWAQRQLRRRGVNVAVDRIHL